MPSALPAAVGVLALLLIFWPVVPLTRYYSQAIKASPSNASLVRAANELKAGMQPADLVIVDQSLNDRRVENASDYDEASSFRVIRYVLELEAVPYDVLVIDEAALSDLTERGQSAVMVLSAGIDGKDTAELGDLIEHFGIVGLDGKPGKAPRPADRYALVRFDPAAAAGQR